MAAGVSTFGFSLEGLLLSKLTGESDFSVDGLGSATGLISSFSFDF
jgi:hypothetical protein